jgi:hypothetical protein
VTAAAWLRYLLVVFFGAAAGLMAAEVGLRILDTSLLPLWMPGLSGRAALLDRPEGFWFSNNDLGYRERQFSRDKAGSTVRVAVCGDSHAFGVGVDQKQRVSEVLEPALQKIVENPIEVLNLAFSGLTLDYYSECHEVALAIEADITVVLAYAGNDFAELLSPRRELRPVPRSPGLVLPFLRRTHLWHLVRAFPQHRPPSRLEAGGLDCQFWLSPPEIGPFTQSLLQACILRNPTRQRQAADLIATIGGRLCARPDVIVAVVPSALGANAPGAEEQVRGLATRLGIEDANSREIEGMFSAILSDACESGGSSVVDLTPTLQETDRAYFPRDWHLAAPGHAAVAAALLLPVAKAAERVVSQSSREGRPATESGKL